MISLYDYLDHAGGKELGVKLAAYAKSKNARSGVREVSNPRYTGKVMLYERTLLDEFFLGKTTEKTTSVIGTNR
jgi:hypothetical protein